MKARLGGMSREEWQSRMDVDFGSFKVVHFDIGRCAPFLVFDSISRVNLTDYMLCAKGV